MQHATRLEFAAFGHENIAFHCPSHLHRFRPDSPHMRASCPIVSVPVESTVPSTSPSMISSFRNLTEPLIETPRERIAPDCIGVNVRLDGAGMTDASGRFVCGGSVTLREGKRVKCCIAKLCRIIR